MMAPCKHMAGDKLDRQKVIIWNSSAEASPNTSKEAIRTLSAHRWLTHLVYGDVEADAPGPKRLRHLGRPLPAAGLLVVAKGKVDGPLESCCLPPLSTRRPSAASKCCRH